MSSSSGSGSNSSSGSSSSSSASDDDDDDKGKLAVEDPAHPLYSPVFKRIRELAGTVPSADEIVKARDKAQWAKRGTDSATPKRVGLSRWAAVTTKKKKK